MSDEHNCAGERCFHCLLKEMIKIAKEKEKLDK